MHVWCCTVFPAYLEHKNSNYKYNPTKIVLFGVLYEC